MDKTCTFLLVCSCLTYLCRGLEVTIYGPTRHVVEPGSQLSLTCGIDQGATLILQYRTKWYHVSSARPSEPVETLMSENQLAKDGAHPDFFAIASGIGDKDFNFTLIFKSVAESDDGKYVCRAHDPSTLETVEKEVDLVVVSDVKNVSMKFDGEEAIVGEDIVGLEREEGDYGVTCEAGDFSPDASIKIFVGDEEQETRGTVITRDLQASDRADARRYSALATATRVRLRADQTGQKLRCEARTKHDGAVTLVASVPLEIIALEPIITCDNASAVLGQMYVRITCQVYHADVDIDSYSWEVMSTGEVISEGVDNVNYNQIHTEDLGNHTTNVTLDLNEVDKSHLDTYYFLDVFTKSGQKFRQPVMLFELPSVSSTDDDATGASSQTAALVLTILISILMTLLISC